MKNSLLLILLVFSTSCSSLYRFTIEIQEPAPVTLPVDITHLLVVNNSLPQPGDVGITRKFKGIEIQGMELLLDSAAWISTAALSSRLQESRFFDRVYCSLQPVRSHGNWMYAEPLPESLRRECFKNRDFDAIISIDRIFLELKEEVNENYFIDIQAEATATCSIYLYNRESPLTTFPVSDSLFYKTIGIEDTLAVFKELPEYLLEELVYNIGEKITHILIPSWTERQRFLFSGAQARMQEALSFARSGKWNRAETLWMNEYAAKSKPLDKGKLAYNIAVAHEMQDRLDSALQWASVAKEHLKTDKSGTTVEIDNYIRDLQQRLQDNPLLDLQWGAVQN